MLNAAAAVAVNGPNQPPSVPVSIKPLHPHPTEMPDPSPSSSTGPILIDGYKQDSAMSKSEFLTRPEVLNRRSRRAKQLARIYRDHYWALMEELKLKYREYYWEYGKSPFVEEEENERMNSSRDGPMLTTDNGNVNGGNGIGNAASRCGVHGCKAKAMALTRFCNMHILSDNRQKLYKACIFIIKSSTTGPILCGKPILRSTVPAYCPVHFQKADRLMVRAFKKFGHNIVSAVKLSPKVHVIMAEYVRHIQQKRRTAKRMNLESAVIKEENNS